MKENAISYVNSQKDCEKNCLGNVLCVKYMYQQNEDYASSESSACILYASVTQTREVDDFNMMLGNCRESLAPSAFPSVHPTIKPTCSPSISEPTYAPTLFPSPIPSAMPTINPSTVPSPYPTYFPSVCPSVNPTKKPTLAPTPSPTLSPTVDCVDFYNDENRCTAHGCSFIEVGGDQFCVNQCIKNAQYINGSNFEHKIFAQNDKDYCENLCLYKLRQWKFDREKFKCEAFMVTINKENENEFDCFLFDAPYTIVTEFNSEEFQSSKICYQTQEPSIFPTTEPSFVPTITPSTEPSMSPTTRIPSSLPSTSPSQRLTIEPSYFPSASPTCIPSNQPTGAPSTDPTSSPLTFSPSQTPTFCPSTNPTQPIPTDSPIEMYNHKIIQVSCSSRERFEFWCNSFKNQSGEVYCNILEEENGRIEVVSAWDDSQFQCFTNGKFCNSEGVLGCEYFSFDVPIGQCEDVKISNDFNCHNVTENCWKQPGIQSQLMRSACCECKDLESNTKESGGYMRFVEDDVLYFSIARRNLGTYTNHIIVEENIASDFSFLRPLAEMKETRWSFSFWIQGFGLHANIIQSCYENGECWGLGIRSLRLVLIKTNADSSNLLHEDEIQPIIDDPIFKNSHNNGFHITITNDHGFLLIYLDGQFFMENWINDFNIPPKDTTHSVRIGSASSEYKIAYLKYFFSKLHDDIILHEFENGNLNLQWKIVEEAKLEEEDCTRIIDCAYKVVQTPKVEYMVGLGICFIPFLFGCLYNALLDLSTFDYKKLFAYMWNVFNFISDLFFIYYLFEENDNFYIICGGLVCFSQLQALFFIFSIWTSRFGFEKKINGYGNVDYRFFRW